MARLKAFDEDKAIDAAVDCFWVRGYEATSVRDLAERMGIGGASLYNAYGDKRALFITALERYANRSMRERIARLEASGRPKQAIEAFLAEIIDRSLKDRARKGCLLVNSALDVAPHDAEIGKVGRGLPRRNSRLLPAQYRGRPPRRTGAAHDRCRGRLGPSAGRPAGDPRACAHRPDRALLESVVRPALSLLDLPVGPAT